MTAVKTDGAGRLAAQQRGRPADTLFRFATIACASIVLILLAGMLIRTTIAAWPAFRHEGISLVTSNNWNPNTNSFGGLSFIYGTLVISVIALILGVPASILIAQKPKNTAAGNAVKAWLEWALQKTQQTEVTTLGYVPLPTKLVALDLAALKTVQ